MWFVLPPSVIRSRSGGVLVEANAVLAGGLQRNVPAIHTGVFGWQCADFHVRKR